MHHLFSTELNTLNFAFTFTSSTYSRVVDFGHYFSPKSTLRLIRESTRTRVYTVLYILYKCNYLKKSAKDSCPGCFNTQFNTNRRLIENNNMNSTIDLRHGIIQNLTDRTKYQKIF